MKNIPSNDELVTTFSILDDLSALLQFNTKGRKNSLSLGEIATISLIKAKYSISNWKSLHTLLKDKFQDDFSLPVYKNFVLTMNKYSQILIIFMNILLQLNEKKSGTIKIIDSAPIPVCKNIRIYQHKTMKSIATRSKTTTGWFYGLKIHIISDLDGNLIKFKFTTANVNDRVVLDEFITQLKNSLILADAGYLSKELEIKANKASNKLLTCTRKNMKKLATKLDISLLNLRPRIESVFSVLKERLGLVTSLPRSINGYFAHLIHVVFGYMFKNFIS